MIRISKDARANGISEVWITEFWPTEGGNLAFGGSWTLTPTAGEGHWDGDCTGRLGAAYFTDKPYQHIGFSSLGYGSGDYEGQVFWLAMHAAQGAPWILKCWGRLGSSHRSCARSVPR